MTRLSGQPTRFGITTAGELLQKVLSFLQFFIQSIGGKPGESGVTDHLGVRVAEVGQPLLQKL